MQEVCRRRVDSTEIAKGGEYFSCPHRSIYRLLCQINVHSHDLAIKRGRGFIASSSIRSLNMHPMSCIGGLCDLESNRSNAKFDSVRDWAIRGAPEVKGSRRRTAKE